MKIKHLFKTLSAAVFIVLSVASVAQKPTIQKVEPANWWVGFNNNTVELLIHGDFEAITAVESKTERIGIEQFELSPTKKHLFVTLYINPQFQGGTAEIELINNKKSTTLSYPIYQRENDDIYFNGVHSSDFMYLLMPDRFANGSTENDSISGYMQGVHRDEPFGRHGGDIAGIKNNLDYFTELGVTALWLNPVLENNQKEESYHGYAITDFYGVDARFGSTQDYIDLIEACHNKGIKMVKDIVLNHIGLHHPWNSLQPTPDWFNNWTEYTNTSFRATTLIDPYASAYDREIFANGWFNPAMPDLNQKNKHVANYLIQAHIWWIETAKIDGFRIDTYPYPDQDFANDFIRAIKAEYPNFTLFGETWVHGNTTQAFYSQNNIKTAFKAELPNVTDFQWHYAARDAVTQDFGWTEGISKMYYTLAKDFLTPNPMQHVTFLDNHDMDRFYGTIGKDFNKYKVGITLLLTTRGIPCLFYGTELLFPEGGPHGILRKDMPGGWAEDSRSVFTAEGRTTEENEAFDFVSTLANFRKSSDALQNGNTIQFVPFDGVYGYFRFTNNQTVFVLINTNKETQTVDLKRFNEKLNGHATWYNVLTKSSSEIPTEIQLNSYESVVYELR